MEKEKLKKIRKRTIQKEKQIVLDENKIKKQGTNRKRNPNQT